MDSIKQPLYKIKPLIFEIGRYRAVDLSPDHGGESIHPGKQYVIPPAQWYKWYEKPFERIVMISVLMVALLVVMLYFISPPFNAFVRRRKTMTARVALMVKVFIMTAVSSVVIACAVTLISSRPDEESFSLFEGISAWPAQLLRCAAILFAGWFLYSSWKGCNRNGKAIEKDLFGRTSLHPVNNSGHRRVLSYGSLFMLAWSVLCVLGGWVARGRAHMAPSMGHSLPSRCLCAAADCILEA